MEKVLCIWVSHELKKDMTKLNADSEGALAKIIERNPNL